MIAAEKEEKTIALLYVHMLRLMTALQTKDFKNGICYPFYCSSFLPFRIINPMRVAASGGKSVKIMGA
jgi:hypothetical protein